MIYKPCVRNSASGLIQISHISKKWQWRHNLLTCRHRQTFLCCRVSLVTFSYWSKFHINIITGSGVPEIGNTLVWAMPNIWRLEWGKIPNFARMSLTKSCWILENTRVTAFIIIELLREKEQEGGGMGGVNKMKIPPQI